MTVTDKSSQGTSPVDALSQNWVAQIRQISIPVWARALALILSIAVLLPGVALIWGGWIGCAEFVKDWADGKFSCNERWIAQGTEIVVAALVPVVVILYLVFAETGIRSLTRRTNELLGKLVPQALHSEGSESATYADGIDSCIVIDMAHAAGSLCAYYCLKFCQENHTGHLRLTVSVNVDKAVIVFFLPVKPDISPEEIRPLMAPTLKGAEHEGYVFDDDLVQTRRDGQTYGLLIARRNLPADFLWNPAAKLHFVWDLRAFTYSVIHDARALLES